MSKINLYAIYRLDPNRSSPELAAALTTALNSTDQRDVLTRNRIETARAVLANPHTRAAYDRQLNDPSAPPVTEATLAQITGRPIPTAPRPSLVQSLKEPKMRVLGGVLAALVVAVIVAATAVACSGGDSDTKTNATGSASSSTANNNSATPNNTTYDVEKSLSYIAWSSTSAPQYTLNLTKGYDLPPAMAAAGRTTQANEGFTTITEYQDHSIGLAISDMDIQPGDRGTNVTGGSYLATYRQDGTLVNQQSYPGKSLSDISRPEPFDLAREVSAGYYRISASQGITIPATANGDAEGKNYAWVLPDAWDKKLAWVLLRGGNQLLKAEVRAAS